MSDERHSDDLDEEEEEYELEITLENLTQVVANDFFSTAKETEKIAEAVKADMENFVKGRKSKTLDVPVDIVSEEDDEYEDKPRVSAYDIIKTSLYRMHEKAVLDFEIIKLFDEYMAKDRERFIREEYVQKYITLLPERFNNDFERINQSTKDKVNRIKSQIKLQDVQQDFALVNSDLKKEVECTKRNIKDLSYIPLSIITPPPDPEELEPEAFVKEGLFQVTHQIKKDIIAAKELNDELVEETKSNINTYVDDMTILNGRSVENVESIRHSVTMLRTKINSALLENTKSIPELITLNALHFIEKEQRLKDIWQCIVNAAIQLRKDLWMKKIEMKDEVDCILQDIIDVAEDIRKRMNMKDIRKSMTEIESIKNVNIDVDLNIEKKMMEVQEDVQLLKRILQSRYDDIKSNADTTKIDTPDVDVAAVILKMLESVTENFLKSFRYTEEKMKQDMEMFKSKRADPNFNPIAGLSIDEMKAVYLQTFKKTDAKLKKDVKMMKSNVKKQLDQMKKRFSARQDNQNLNNA